MAYEMCTHLILYYQSWYFIPSCFSMQVLVLVKFVVEFIVSNPFIVCSDELNFIKKQLHREGDEIKVKQKAGVIQYRAYQGRSVCTLKLDTHNTCSSWYLVLSIQPRQQSQLRVIESNSHQLQVLATIIYYCDM